MVNIDTVYQKVLALANKEQRGYITPQEFNLFADQAQKEIFEQYFYDQSKLEKQHGKSEEYSDIPHNLNEKISMFESTSDINGGFIAATNLYRLGTVIVNDLEVEQVQQNELLYINQSYLTKPTINRRVYVRKALRVIEITPTASFATCTYVTTPPVPSWGYFVVGGKALHDSSSNKTTHFKLHPSEENELVYKILKYSGISMKRDDIMRAGQGMEIMQGQQEKPIK